MLSETQAPYVIINPSLEVLSPDGLYELVKGLVGDIFKQTDPIPRLDNRETDSFQVSVLS